METSQPTLIAEKLYKFDHLEIIVLEPGKSPDANFTMKRLRDVPKMTPGRLQSLLR